MFPKLEADMLKAAARKLPPEHKDVGKPNKALDDLITGIKLLHPTWFLSKDDLSERKFFHKPLQIIPYKSFVKDRV